MSFKPYVKWFRNNQPAAFTGINALFKSFHKLVYPAAAEDGGLFAQTSVTSCLAVAPFTAESAMPESNVTRRPPCLSANASR